MPRISAIVAEYSQSPISSSADGWFRIIGWVDTFEGVPVAARPMPGPGVGVGVPDAGRRNAHGCIIPIIDAMMSWQIQATECRSDQVRGTRCSHASCVALISSADAAAR